MTPKQHIKILTGIFETLGFSVGFIAPEEIPDIDPEIQRRFHNGACQFGPQIWITTTPDRRKYPDWVSMAWHEAGHALADPRAAERGLYAWLRRPSYSGRPTQEEAVEIENDACEASYALMTRFGVPKVQIRTFLGDMNFNLASNFRPVSEAFLKRNPPRPEWMDAVNSRFPTGG